MELNRKLKVLTVVGTRPEIIRLSRVLAKLDASPAIEHVLVHTGQNYDYELNQIFFEDLELRKPDHFLNAAGKTASETIGQILINIDQVLEKEQPDAFLVLGDTNSCLCAIPAKKRHIPIFHMEAGNRCFVCHLYLHSRSAEYIFRNPEGQYIQFHIMFFLSTQVFIQHLNTRHKNKHGRHAADHERVKFHDGHPRAQLPAGKNGHA